MQRVKHSFAVVLALFLSTACGGIAHTIIRPPQYAGHAEDGLAKIGSITSARSVKDVLYLGAQKGIAAVDASGRVLWTLELPATLTRLVDGDGQHVAFTSYDITGLKEAEGLRAFFLGDIGAEPSYANAYVGLASADGKLLWNVKTSEQIALSPPAIGPNAVAVNLGQTFGLYSLANGAEKIVPFGSERMGTNSDFMRGVILQATRNRPVVLGNDYFAGFYASLLKADSNGQSLFNKQMFGLFSQFNNITVGPVVFKDKLIFGSAPLQNKNALVYAATAEPDKDWKEYVDDTDSAPGSIATNSKYVFVATNFVVTAFNEKGSKEWDAVNHGGGLYPSSYRGVRYHGHFPSRRSHGNLMVASDDKLYITSKIKSGDVITVLNAEDGKYVETLEIASPIVELAIVGDKLAVVGTDKVQYLALK